MEINREGVKLTRGKRHQGTSLAPEFRAAYTLKSPSV